MTDNKRSYYPHIDALRAFAVLTVIVFHINHNYLPGGFVGVDIFFVISGFLITSHILKDVANGKFSLSSFYNRRIKRILPAAFSVIFVTLVAAQYFYLPEDAIKVSQSGIWSALSLSNVYFWKFQDTGYFASASYTLPLLHYWSLGVEEQFYVFWPLVILFLYNKVKAKLFLFIIILTILVSALLAEQLLESHHSFIYYMLPSRSGELLVGALLAALLHYKIIEKPNNANLTFFVAIIALILLSLIHI